MILLHIVRVVLPVYPRKRDNWTLLLFTSFPSHFQTFATHRNNVPESFCAMKKIIGSVPTELIIYYLIH